MLAVVAEVLELAALPQAEMVVLGVEVGPVAKPLLLRAQAAEAH